MCVNAKCTYGVRENQSGRGVAAATYMNSVSLMCQGRKPSVLSTGPNFKTSSGSGIFLESGRAQTRQRLHARLTVSKHAAFRARSWPSQTSAKTSSTAASVATSEAHVQQGDADVFGRQRFVLHRAAELLGCLDNALLPVLRGEQLHSGSTRHN